jgi:hypothetical protein
MSDVLHSRAPLSFIPLAPFLSRVEFLGEMSDVLHSRAPLPLIPLAPFLSRVEFLGEMSDVLHSRAPLSLIPLAPFLSRVEFLGEMSDVLHSRAPLPLIPPAPFSHEGRRGSLGVLMPETGVLRYIDHSSYPSCRTGRPPLAERRPKFISVTAWSVRFRECPTSSTGFNLCENCYNPVYALAVGLMEIEK